MISRGDNNAPTATQRPFQNGGRTTIVYAILVVIFAINIAAFSIYDARKQSILASFDHYVFSQEWLPVLCEQELTAACLSPKKFWKSHLTIHGLWPDLASGQPPAPCFGPDFNDSVLNEIGLDRLRQEWPDIFRDPNQKVGELWKHEWNKHGKCSGLSQREYMEEALHLLEKVGTPTILQTQTSFRKDDFIQEYGPKNVVLQCLDIAGTDYLRQVETCWAKKDNVPSHRIDCPVHSRSSCDKELIYVMRLLTSKSTEGNEAFAASVE